MEYLFVVLPDLIVTIGVPLVVVGGSAALVSRTEIGRALIDRIRSGRVDSLRMEQLAADLERVHEDLLEVQERLDTTELLLQSKRRELGQIDGGAPDG